MEQTLYEAHAKLSQTHWWFEGRRAVLREVMRKHLGPRTDLRVLDVGAGTFANLGLLEEFGAVTGLESSPEAIAMARALFGARVNAIQGEVPSDVPPGPWDVITMLDVLEHVDAPVESLRALKAELAPAGKLILTVPAWPFMWSAHDEAAHHHLRYTPQTLRAHLEAGGFNVDWWSGYNTLLFPPAAAVRLLQRVLGWKSASGNDLEPVARPLNAVLRALFSAERFVVPHTTLPFGVSLVAVASPR